MADWFAQKRYGYGAGLPIAWQGWAVLIGYLAIVGGSLALFHDRPLVPLAIMLPATAIVLLIAARTTRGGWRWRWGRKG
jgi:hypothetical protein